MGERSSELKESRINESSRCSGILLKAVEKSNLTDTCTYTDTINIFKDQGNWGSELDGPGSVEVVALDEGARF
jgi:hypothetical protein